MTIFNFFRNKKLASFSFFFQYFQSNITMLQQMNVKMSIQNTMPGFENTIF